MLGINLKQYDQFLTKNLRNKLYLKKNSSRGRAIADSKWKTKRILEKAGVGVPKLIGRLKTVDDIENFEWNGLEGNFVIKPESGYGGEGIVIVRKKIEGNELKWHKMDGSMILEEDMKMHCGDILAGRYSLHGMPDKVLIEERIKIHPKFLTLTRAGTPDIRVIIYNSVPIMAMIRIPTARSKGKANLQQGAVGLGIDLATGITTYGIVGKGEVIEKMKMPKKKKMIKVNGIKIPFWKEVLETTITCQKTMKGLGFMGVDVVLDKEKGPMVLELNARPGLSIQICNKAGLKSRMDKIDDVNVRSTDHGMSLAKYLFGEGFFEKVSEKEKVSTVEPLEVIRIKIGKGKKNYREVRAKIDTGAFRSSIDRKLAEELGLLNENRILYYRHYRSALGKNVDRPVVGVTFWLKDKKVTTAVNVADRKKLRTKFLLGRKDLDGFLVSAKRTIVPKVKTKLKKVREIEELIVRKKI